MLRSLALVALLLGVVIPAYADNKPGTFGAYYFVLSEKLKPTIRARYADQCKKLSENAKCDDISDFAANGYIGFAVYRLTTEKQMDGFGHVADCFQGKEPEANCVDVKNFMLGTIHDFDRVIVMNDKVSVDLLDKAVTKVNAGK